MPELDDDATIGDLTGVCVAEGPQERVEQSADFLVNLLSDDAVTTMADTGYLMPTKLDVSFSDAFLQPDLQPANARAFVSSTPVDRAAAADRRAGPTSRRPSIPTSSGC